MALKITMSKSGAAAEKYFNAHLKASDYLSQDGARPGIWFGEGAKRLGLEGEVAAKDFLALAGNKNPNTGERLTVRDGKNARPGYDFTFSGPKSFAAVWARTGDERLIEALKGSILDTIRLDIEPEMKTRLRRAGQDSDLVTANLVGSLFMHDTTRPLKEDNKPDPHPHGHAYICNRTWAAHENRWQAAQLGDLHLDGRYFEAAFKARLGHRLNQLGYVLERDGKGGWEIAGVPASVNLKFSRRRFQEILPEAERLGITDGAGRATLGKRTRQEKVEGEILATPALHAYWNSRLSGEEAAALDAVAARAQAGSTGGRLRVTAEQAIRHSLEHFFGADGRNSAEAEKAIREEALRYGAGSVLPEEIKKELDRQDLIHAEIGGRIICTTAAVLAEEQALKQSAWSGRHACLPLSKELPYGPQAALAAARGRKEKLDGEQAEAVRHLLDSEDRTQILIGKAGTGKTTTLQELDRALRERGRKLMAFAPTARASRGVLRQKGFATADTLANLLGKPELQSQVRGQVILIDEAGLAGTRALRQVLDLVDRHQAQGHDTRVILVGDPLQHRGVPRGQVLSILQEQAGLTPARLSTIRRQKDPGYRQAVELLSAGRAGEAFDQLDRLGFIREVADGEERYRAMAKDYADCHAAGDSEMIISPTHAEGRAVSAAVRAELKSRELLGAEDRTLLRLENKDRSIAQRKDAASYDIGDTIQWGQNVPGFGRGERVKVVGRDGGRVLVEDKRGQVKELPLPLAERFELYRTESLPVADGERLRVTRNGYAFTADGKQHALNNGDVVTVRFTKQGDLVDQRGWIIPATFGHLASGVVTSVASQGMDDQVPFLAQSTTSRGAASTEQFYVSVSRGIKSLHLYTDDKEALRASVVRSSQARTAAEVFEASQRQQKAEAQSRRKAWWQRQRRRTAALGRQKAARQQQQISESVKHRLESRGFGYAQS
jgi:conjugative relaxase-like TrwC/TraI family protein